MSQHRSPAENGLITAETGQALMARPCGLQKRIFATYIALQPICTAFTHR
ncbi:hypothetical protein F385_3450 [Pantoea agglomerans 299R]|nr:hypothetical protein F385_3450 [Pantoea agglomerans 299R]